MTGNVQVLDCTIRDGGYNNNWEYEKKVVREVYRALSKSGVDMVEIGFRGSEKYFDRETYGTWRFTTDEDIREVTANINGPALAVMGDYGKIEVDDFADASESAVSLVRLAVHKDKSKEGIELLQQIKAEKGYQVSLNAMGYATCTDAERWELARMLEDSGLEYVFMADSYGSMLPHQIEGLAEPLLSLKDIKVGFHAHNNLQMAFANSLEAIRCGISTIDCSLFGMGRGPGNLPTEILLAYLQSLNQEKYNVVPVLSVIDLYFRRYFEQHPWGYQLPYMMSGVFACHPYYANYLVSQRRFPIHDIWNILEVIKAQDPVGYSEELARSIVEDTPIGALRGDREFTLETGPATQDRAKPHQSPPSPPERLGYAGRHQDRPFLVLGNGPTLKSYQDRIQQFIDQYDPIVLGANYLGGLFKPHYHTFVSLKRFQKYIDTVDPASRLLISPYIPLATIREYTDKDYETLWFHDVLNAPFSVDEAGTISTNCRTVSVLLLGVALVMGASQVYGAGLDGYLGSDDNLFYDEEDYTQDREMSAERHRWCEHHIEAIDAYVQERGGEGLHILTPTSYRKVYKGIQNYI